MRVGFGEFVFDSERRELRRGAEVVHLAPKAFKLLEILIEERPRAVAKRDLYDRLWEGTFVVEANLKVLVSDIRRVIEQDPAEPRWLTTVFGFGYVFADAGVETLTDIRQLPPGTIFTLQVADRHVVLYPGDNILGREADNAVVVDAPGVSRHHAKITIRGESATLEDLGSKNGTFIGRQRIEDGCELRDGDEIRLGKEILLFHARHRATSTLTEPPEPDSP